MNAPRFIPLHKARLALWIWRPWTAAPRYRQELRLLERRVAAARFGINAPQKFVGSSVHECMLEETARVLP
jgi:hypothetical protein